MHGAAQSKHNQMGQFLLRVSCTDGAPQALFIFSVALQSPGRRRINVTNCKIQCLVFREDSFVSQEKMMLQEQPQVL